MLRKSWVVFQESFFFFLKWLINSVDIHCYYLLSLPLFSAQNMDIWTILNYNIKTKAICKNDLAERLRESWFSDSIPVQGHSGIYLCKHEKNYLMIKITDFSFFFFFFFWWGEGWFSLVISDSYNWMQSYVIQWSWVNRKWVK